MKTGSVSQVLYPLCVTNAIRLVAWVKLNGALLKNAGQNGPAKKKKEKNMKPYLSLGIMIAASLAVTNLAVARGGGGGGHFSGGSFGGGGMHFSAPGMHFSARVPTSAATFYGGRHLVSGQRQESAAGNRHRFGHHRAVFSQFWPSSEYYYGDSDYADSGTDFPTSGDDTDSDSAVAAVQKALARGGYYHGPVDGTLDLITQDAIARYDRDHRLPVSHAINQQLLNSLRVE